MERKSLLPWLLLTNVSTLVAPQDPAKALLDNVALGIRQIRLPDGKSLFGDTTAIMGLGDFDPGHKNEDEMCSLAAFCKFMDMLEYPIKTDGWFHKEYHTPSEALKYFQKLVDNATHCDGSALQLIWHFLRSGNLHGLDLPGLRPQPSRAALFKEMYDWSRGRIPNATHALEEMRRGREEIKALAAKEEAKLKRAAAAIASAEDDSENTATEPVKKHSLTETQEHGLRQRKFPNAATTVDPAKATMYDLLLSHKSR